MPFSMNCEIRNAKGELGTGAGENSHKSKNSRKSLVTSRKWGGGRIVTSRKRGRSSCPHCKAKRCQAGARPQRPWQSSHSRSQTT